MKIKSIVTMDPEISFTNVEVLNFNNTEELDKAIQNNKVITFKENGKIYNLNSSYIIFYQ